MAVAIVSTGGTIASTDDTENDATPSLTGADLVEAVPQLKELTTVEVVDFSKIPSPHFTIEQMYTLVTLLHDLDQREQIEGIVVTQGTDILEETSLFSDICYSGDTPVVFTGAMRKPSLPSPDGPVNLLASVRVALTAVERQGTVFVVFNDRIHAPSGVTKTHTMNVDTFRTPEFGPLGSVLEGSVVWQRYRQHDWPILNPEQSQLSNDIPAIFATADMTDRLLRYESSPPDALCIATTGAGHIPPAIIPALESYCKNNIPIVATSRCPEGRLARQTYGYHGSERTLRELDCYFSSLNLQKTRIATILGAATGSLDDLFSQP